MSRTLSVTTTAIPGLLLLDLPVHGDARGWLKENWQRAKMTALGLPDFGPVQHTVAYNASAGVTRGIHAEPWDKFISVAAGRMFGAWVDLREGPSFGSVVTAEVGPDTAVFVPRGVGNSYQTLEDDTVYSYLVNDHWSAESLADYTYLNLADETAAIHWPIPLSQAIISAADAAHPRLAEVSPMPGRRTVIIGANGQLGSSLRALLPDAVALGRAELDLADPDSVDRFDWRGVGTIINAAGYTAVDAAETPQGRADCWRINVSGVGRLVARARQLRARLVHISSDYVFDGSTPEHAEDEPYSPLGVYGQTKAAGDAPVATLEAHYIVRTSWVVGAGSNFVATMAALAERGVNPAVVDDQIGRLTFTDDLAAAILHLLGSGARYGCYNMTNSGPAQSWADIAARVFELSGRNPEDVSRVSTEAYASGKQLAPRPRHSTLNLDKLIATGFNPAAADDRLIAYLSSGR
ncbi:MAG: sugar nucleotide-binding protein [Micropruina sp.]